MNVFCIKNKRFFYSVLYLKFHFVIVLIFAMSVYERSLQMNHSFWKYSLFQVACLFEI